MTTYTHDPRLLDNLDWTFANRHCNDPQRKVLALLVLSDGREIYGTNRILWNFNQANLDVVWNLNRDIARGLVQHAEQQAIFAAVDRGVVNFNGSLLIVSLEPCERCKKLIEAVGIPEVFYGEKYVPSE